MEETWDSLGIRANPRRSGNQKASCPQCSHTRKKHPHDKPLSFDTDTGLYFCHHCGWTGKLNTSQSSTRYGSPLEHHERPREYRRPTPPGPADDNALELRNAWLATRGISVETADDAMVTSGLAYMPQNDGGDPIPTIQFPFYRDGELINVKFRARGKQFRMEKDAELIWYGLDWCRDAETVYVCEGEVDALSLREVGYAAVLSVPNGAPPKPTNADQQSKYNRQFPYLDSGADIFATAKRVILAMDADEPGEYLRDELARRIGYVKTYTVAYPPDCKDCNDVLVKHGPDALRNAIEHARPYPVEGIILPDDLTDAVLALRGKNPFEGWLVGWRDVERLYRPAPQMVTVITGVPSSGKSKLVDAIALNLIEQYGYRVGFCSPENWPPQLHLRQMIQYRTGKDFMVDPWAGGITDDEIRKEIDYLKDHVRFILPEKLSLDDIMQRAEVLVFRDGIQGLIIDPFTALSHNRPASKSMPEYIAEFITALRKLARDNNLHVWVVAHPTKQVPIADTKGKFQTPVVDPYSIRDAAAWFDLADFILSVHRDKNDPKAPVQLHVQKVRHQGYNGELGMAKLYFDPQSYRYSETPRGTVPVFGQQAA